jgi:hypothetical protein
MRKAKVQTDRPETTPLQKTDYDKRISEYIDTGGVVADIYARWELREYEGGAGGELSELEQHKGTYFTAMALDGYDSE